MKSSTSARLGSAVATATAVVLATAGVGVMGAALARDAHVPRVPGADATPVAAADYHAPVPMPKKSHTARPAVLPDSRPVILRIPSIGVHSIVQRLGQEADGSLETPAPGPHYDEAAWYRYSPTPGSLGPAVLLGHVDSAEDGPSVFYRLSELRQGDRISVSRADGSVAVFFVDEVHRYAKDDFPTGLVYDDIDHAGLRIVTCGGAFDESTDHYLDNVVVFASLRDRAET